jgi:hypothetical protein
MQMSLRPRIVLRKGQRSDNFIVLGGNHNKITQNRQSELIHFSITIYLQLILNL